MSKKDKDIKNRLNNVIPVFPNGTDELMTYAQWEDALVPFLMDQMQTLWTAADAGDHEVICKISQSLMRYVYRSLQLLEAQRRNGDFDDNQLPGYVAHAFDNLLADYMQAINKEDDSEFVEQLRTRMSSKKSN